MRKRRIMKVPAEHDDTGCEVVLQAYREAANELTQFVNSDSFIRLLEEIYSLPENLRHESVEFMLLDSDVLRIRGIIPPLGVEIQRSYFSDGRPTLFCVTKRLPKELLWKKLTVTFDNETVTLAKPAFAVDEFGELLPILRPL